MSDRTCKKCGDPIKLKHLIRAKENKHRPPDLCFNCDCAETQTPTPRERKITLAKQRAREREAAKKGFTDGPTV
jgi:hypothetical protein